MAIHLLRHHFDLEAAERGVRSFSGAEVAALRLILEGRIDRETCVAEMASAVGLGVAHFGRVFRDTFGRAPHDYLRERRLARAHELLISTAMSIADIAGRTGFADQSHMTRCFKQRFGAPPAHLRRIERRPSSGRIRQDL
jgi:AraC family transcriptional regulator